MKLRKILNEISKSEKLIGSGKNGTAYDIGNNKIKKITKSENEYIMATHILSDNPYWHCKIYTTDKISSDKYVIVKEKVNPINIEMDSMIDGNNPNFEFSGRQWVSDKTVIEQIAKILKCNVIEHNNIFSIEYAFAPYYMCQPSSWGEKFKIKRIQVADAVEIAKLMNYNSKKTKIYVWWCSAFFDAVQYDCDPHDLYSNIGMVGNTPVFFDVM